ncbi:alpha/beta fold hydrolase [Calothrix sp. NIES-3974]|uniref:alpha/beta fold hydrolase n=1 Tax=Calothrix sp. NIES-3974 TaxID=2005462 RepID=UPI000B5E26E2|nr:alpha/beta hydrolase [Calothrix sp. NIES-3974]BAZ05643.1 hypothetical protein NIES3974_22950 [Calothrix sp. NIES-3974]
MSINLNMLWVSASPALRFLDEPVLNYLSQYTAIARWEYHQTVDEGGSSEVAVCLLLNIIKQNKRPIHLIGHGVGGVIALLFARRYPELVSSLTLLAVAVQPANTWHAHYYQQRKLFSLSRQQVLLNTVYNLFREKLPCQSHRLVNIFSQDLDNIPLSHSLLQIEKISKGSVSMPLMVCGSKTDPIVSYPELHGWREWLKPQDVIWECPQGSHFFHYFYPEKVADQVLKFWNYSAFNHHQANNTKIQN